MASHFVPLHPVLNHQGQGLGVVDDLQEGEDGHVLHVAVVDTAADRHQGLQPQGEAGITSCSQGKGWKQPQRWAHTPKNPLSKVTGPK